MAKKPSCLVDVPLNVAKSNTLLPCINIRQVAQRISVVFKLGHDL